MKKITISIALIFISFLGFSEPAEISEVEQNYVSGIEHIANNDYSSALSHFLYLDQVNSNANIAYNIGLCYLNSNLTKEQLQAEEYLERASKDVSKNHVNKYNETKAPVKALYLLGISYLKSYKFDKSIEMVHQYMSQISSKEKSEMNESKILLNNINKAKQNFKFADASLHIIKKVNKLPLTSLSSMDKLPENIVGVDENSNCVVIKNKSNELFKINIKTSMIENIGSTNSFNNILKEEQDGCLSPDGKTLYFSSNKQGGFGGYDIYKCTLNSNGQWSQPENLGSRINSSGDEISPYVLNDDSTIFFSSNGSKSMGGFDVLTSTISDEGIWNESENLGFPINTINDEKGFKVSKSEDYAYFLSSKQNMNFDLFQVNMSNNYNVLTLQNK